MLVQMVVALRLKSFRVSWFPPKREKNIKISPLVRKIRKVPRSFLFEMRKE
jgi:hypothetical protein